MTKESRNPATPEGASASTGGPRDDAYVNQLGDRLGADPFPAESPGMPGGRVTSDVQIRTPNEDMDDPALDTPPLPGPSDSVDAFADFEDEIEGENTRIDDSHLLAEQSTAIIEELPKQPFLHVESGNDKGREFVLQEGENGIGRGIDNDVILADVSVSRRHVRIVRQGDTLTLKDLGSGNGTQVNGTRVTQVVLTDGDRIEAGETTMVVRLPGAQLAIDDPYDPAGYTHESAVTDGSQTPSSLASDPFAVPASPGYSPELTPSETAAVRADRARPSGAGITISKPIFFAVLAVGALLLTMFGALIAILIVTSSSSEEQPIQTVTLADDPGPYERGVRAFDARRWDEAERAFNEALQETPSETRAQDYLARTRTAREHETTLGAARTALSGGDGNLALQHASSLPEDSVFASDANEVAAQARAQLVAHHVGAGRAALVRGDAETARHELETARTYGPTSEAVTSLAQEIGGDAEEPPAVEAPPVEEPPPAEPPTRTTPTRTPSRPSGPTSIRRAPAGGGSSAAQRSVITAYLAGRFGPASQLARTAAGSARGADRTRLETLASRIDRFAPLWSRITAARFGANVRPQMEQAMALDRQIASNAHYRNQLKGPIVQAYLADARRARSNPATSCRAVRGALAVDPSSGPASQMGRECEAQARGMLREGQNAPASRAMAIARQVMLMVPSSSPVYRDARTLLDRHRRRSSVDEDE